MPSCSGSRLKPRRRHSCTTPTSCRSSRWDAIGVCITTPCSSSRARPSAAARSATFAGSRDWKKNALGESVPPWQGLAWPRSVGVSGSSGTLSAPVASSWSSCHDSTADHSSASPQFRPDPSSTPSTRSRAFFRAVAQFGTQAAEAARIMLIVWGSSIVIKPANLLIDVRGNLWITDFGLARMQAETGLTMTGDVIGTLRYMSPRASAVRDAESSTIAPISIRWAKRCTSSLPAATRLQRPGSRGTAAASRLGGTALPLGGSTRHRCRSTWRRSC